MGTDSSYTYDDEQFVMHVIVEPYVVHLKLYIYNILYNLYYCILLYFIMYYTPTISIKK